MLEIPIGVNVTKEQAQKAIEDFVNGVRGDLKDIIGPGNFTLQVETKFTETGAKEVVSRYAEAESASKKYEQALKKSVSTQTGSATSLRQSINTLKQQRDALIRGSDAWKGYNEEISKTAAKLRAQQGIQVGSLTDLRRQRDELIKLRDATSRFPSGPSGAGGGPTWDDLNKQIKALDGSINKVTPGFSQFFSVLSRVATLQAGFIAITSALGAIGGVINAYVGRTKQVEAFNLALKNVGLTQTETSKAFKDAAAIANRLGAPIQQVEKSYQRMVPALRAVGADSAKTSKFIENITARTQTLGLNTEQSGRLLEAFAQVLSKGKLQAEELNQQISELDGAFRSQLADALGVSTEQLTELVEQGEITAPVFVDAVNKMSNGVEELQKRVANGTATIQQLQNLIGNINVQILQEIGKQIEPGIRAFLRLSLAVAEFFKEFTKTESFATLTLIFNQIAKGLEVFVTNLLKAVEVVNAILSPVFSLINALLGLDNGFGGLIGLVINFAGALLLVKGALAGLKLIQVLTGNLNNFGKSLIAAGGGLDILANKSNPGFFDTLRQKLENTRAAVIGLGSKLKEAGGEFLGFQNRSKGVAQSLDNIAKSSKGLEGGVLALATQLNASGKLDPKAAERYAQTLISSYAKVDASAIKSGKSTQDLVAKYYNLESSAAGASKGVRATGAAALASVVGINTASSEVKEFGANLRANLSGIAVGALFAAIVSGIGQIVQSYQNAARVQKEYASSSSAALQVLIDTQDKYKRSTEEINKVVNQSKQSFDQAKASIETTAASASRSGNGLNTLAGVLFTVAGGAAIVAATLLSGGTAGLAFGAAIAVGGASAAGGIAATQKAAKELEKSAIGRGILASLKQFDKGLAATEARIKGLGGSVGQVDFSGFAKGSKNLNLLRDQFAGAVAGVREFIGAQEELLKTELKRQSEAKNEQERQEIQNNIDAIRGVIAAKTEELKKYEESVAAIQLEIASRIAAGDATAAQRASVEELNKALELQNEAIDTSVLEQRTKALQVYGQTQAQVGQLEAANLGIELGATQQRLAANQKLLDGLNARKAENGKLTAEEQDLARELTGTIAEETFKQAEIQKQLGDAIVAGFERGMQKAREISGVYGQVASSAKSQFDNIFGGVTSGVGAALSLVDAVAAKELEGVQQGSLLRKKIIIEQLKAAAEANAAEAQLGQLKLAIQNKIAQNEARIAQIRFETEARLAELRGETGLAQAYREAATAQGDIISGLQTQYELESKTLDIQRQTKDQQLIQKALSEGIGGNAQQAAQWIGVQNVNLKDARKSLSDMIENGGRLVNSYGAAAQEASDIQTEVEGTEMSQAEQEAENVRTAFEATRQSVEGFTEQVNSFNNKLSNTPDLVLNVVNAMNNLEKSIQKNVDLVAKLDSIISGSGSGGARGGAALPARAMGGPVAGGSQYLVNDGGGREGFINKFGSFSMLPAARNISWTAPSSGMVVPAHLVDRYRRAADLNKQIASTSASSVSNTSRGNMMSSSVDSGNLIQRVATAMSGSGSTQRITNNVTIQSQEPVMDASKIMTNVARMRLRNARRG